MTLAYRAPATDRRIGLLLTVLAHVGLMATWLTVRTLPAPASDNAVRNSITWIPLLVPKPRLREPAPAPEKAYAPRPLPDLLPRSSRLVTPLPAPSPDDAATPTPVAPAATANIAEAPPPAAAQAAKPNTEQILEQARRDLRGIDKALRKENKPYIAAPLDSPQIRLQRGMEEAHAMAPNKLWEAPKVEELVNQTGDGARRSRVITGNGTYCITERAPTTSIDMIEKHGKLRFTNCPQHESTATQQAWRSLQD
ncbi:MAG: hypothetical protein WCC39_17275 [Telluria sp.]